ncbi:hypothetical protein BLA29_008507 [Euroglyphus maynei]|uniref:Uncharacterized protein n=1 Tax=Euroglyphus maynei TaxID=6958 RepID=A0A1Y3BIG5_EURMA|nr:hypothetical protein BLA29_008507 [Euroglyphus maynei]
MSWNLLIIFVLAVSVHMRMANASFMLTRDDCADLYSMIGASGQQQPDNAVDIIRRITQHRMNGDGLVRLYDLCLRSEEGIRYRRALWRPSLLNASRQDYSNSH